MSPCRPRRSTAWPPMLRPARRRLEIFEVKGRPRATPSSSCVQCGYGTPMRAAVAGGADQLAAAFWPGPLTLILPRSKPCEHCHRRRPDRGSALASHRLSRRSFAPCGFPLAAPSANPSAKCPPPWPNTSAKDLGSKSAPVVDGGPTQVGLGIRLMDISGLRPQLLRRA